MRVTISVKKIQEGFAQVDLEIPTGISKNGCYFLGKTGVGKSTSINYLMEQEMKSLFNKKQVMCLFRSGNYEISPAEASERELPKIGHTFKSQTMIPKRYISRNGLLLIDTPGSQTTMGVFQQIKDSYANSKIFIKRSSIKIIFVIDDPTLKSSKGQFIVEPFQRLYKMFQNQFESLVNSVCIIFTKIAEKQIDKSDIAARIENIITQHKSVNKEKAHLFDFILKVVRQNQVFILKIHQFNTSQTIAELTKSIKSIPSYELIQNAKLVLSAQCKTQLIDYARFIQQQTPQIFNEFQIFFEKILLKGKRKNISELEQFYKDLFDIKQKYSEPNNFGDEKVLRDFLNSFQKVQSCQERLFQKTLRIFREIKFCQNLYQSIECTKIMTQLISGLKITIEKLNTIIQQKLKEKIIEKKKQGEEQHRQKVLQLEETLKHDRAKLQEQKEKSNQNQRRYQERITRLQSTLAEVSRQNSSRDYPRGSSKDMWIGIIKQVAKFISFFVKK